MRASLPLARRTRAEIAKPDAHGMRAHLVVGRDGFNGDVCVLEVESRDEGIGLKESPWHENGCREKICLHLHHIDAKRRCPGPKIHSEILIVMNFLALM